MDIKDLNKSQLILLAILLSFITSIATGITTVTLMQQAPASVTVPINRIVRQTVEKIVPVPGEKTVQTVIIKEEDLVVDAIAKNKSAIFSITKEIQDIDGKTIEVGAGNGFVISADGVIVADGSLVPEKGVLYVKNDSGKFNADFISLSKNGFTLLKIGKPLNEKDKVTFTVPDFGDLSKLKIGQKILVLGNTISSFIFSGDKDIKLNVTKSNGGSMVLDLDGEVLGVALSGDIISFASIGLVAEALKVDVSLPIEVPKTP
ncbi:MAG: S1C family serine protease [Candidatus Paceibacterota bacterium]